MSTDVDAFRSYFLSQIWFEAFVISRGRKNPTTGSLLLILFVSRSCPSTQAVMETRRSVKQSWLLSCVRPRHRPHGRERLWPGTCPVLLRRGGRRGGRGAAAPRIPPSLTRLPEPLLGAAPPAEVTDLFIFLKNAP